MNTAYQLGAKVLFSYHGELVHGKICNIFWHTGNASAPLEFTYDILLSSGEDATDVPECDIKGKLVASFVFSKKFKDGVNELVDV